MIQQIDFYICTYGYVYWAMMQKVFLTEGHGAKQWWMSLPYRALDGLVPTSLLVVISYMLLSCLSAPVSLTFIQILNHAVLTYTKGLPTCCSFCGDSLLPRFTPTVSQISNESTFPRQTCWDLLTRSNPSSHALIIQSTLSSWL